MVSVFAPGADVKVNDGIPAKVVQVCVTNGGESPHVQYQVAWFDGRTRHLQWLESFELGVVADGDDEMVIGFRQAGS